MLGRESPQGVLPDRALYLPTASHLLIVNNRPPPKAEREREQAQALASAYSRPGFVPGLGLGLGSGSLVLALFPELALASLQAQSHMERRVGSSVGSSCEKSWSPVTHKRKHPHTQGVQECERRGTERQQ